MRTAKKTNTAKASSPVSLKWNVARSYAVLVVLVAITFGNTIRNDYSLDDNLDIYENTSVLKGFAGIPEIFQRPFVQMEHLKFDYRPIAPVTFAVEYQCFGLNPHISHFINLLLYILAVLLSFRLLTKLLPETNPFVIFLIVALFAVHPLHTEVVASLKNRQELLSYIFGISALMFTFQFLKEDKRKILHAVAVAVCITLAVFSKLASLPFIAMILFMLFYYGKTRSQLHKIVFAGVLIAIPVIFVLFTKKWLFRTFNFDENPLVFYSSFSYKAGTTFKIFLYYIRLLVFPYPMSFYYGYNTMPVVRLYEPVALIGLLFFGGLFVLSIRWLWKQNRLGILLLFFLIALSMYNNITFTYPGLLSDRAMFMPSLWFIAGLVLVADDGIQKHPKRVRLQKAGSVAVLVIVLICSAYSIKRNAQWKTQLSIMEADIGHLQNSSLANFYYGWTLQSDYIKNNNSASIQKAMVYYLETIRISPGMPEPYYRIGRYLREVAGNLDSSAYYLTEFTKRDSLATKGSYELGLTQFYQQKYQKAYENFDKVYRRLPDDTLTLFYMVQTTYMLKGVNPALDLNKQLMKVAPQTQYPYLNEASLLKVAGDEKGAISNLEKAVQYGCRTPAVLGDIIAYYDRQNDQATASQYRKYLSAH